MQMNPHPLPFRGFLAFPCLVADSHNEDSKLTGLWQKSDQQWRAACMSPHSSEAGADYGNVKVSAESSDSHGPHHGAKLLPDSGGREDEGLRKSGDKEFQSTNPGDMMTLASSTVRSV